MPAESLVEAEAEGEPDVLGGGGGAAEVEYLKTSRGPEPAGRVSSPIDYRPTSKSSSAARRWTWRCGSFERVAGEQLSLFQWEEDKHSTTEQYLTAKHTSTGT